MAHDYMAHDYMAHDYMAHDKMAHDKMAGQHGSHGVTCKACAAQRMVAEPMVVDASDTGRERALPGGRRDLVLLRRPELPESIDATLHLLKGRRRLKPLQNQRALLGGLRGALLGRLRSRVALSSEMLLRSRSLALRSVGRCRMVAIRQPHGERPAAQGERSAPRAVARAPRGAFAGEVNPCPSVMGPAVVAFRCLCQLDALHCAEGRKPIPQGMLIRLEWYVLDEHLGRTLSGLGRRDEQRGRQRQEGEQHRSAAESW